MNCNSVYILFLEYGLNLVILILLFVLGLILIVLIIFFVWYFRQKIIFEGIMQVIKYYNIMFDEMK